jgi:hypothetical protein
MLVHNDNGLGDIDWGDPKTFDPNVLQGRTAAEIDSAIPSD